jgi:hypothetical protein
MLLSRVVLATDGVWIGEWIYWPLTGRNYKYADFHTTKH